MTANCVLLQAIDKLEKDNFGLKLKIHYLQERIDRAGPEYNQAALKENTELKVVKLTLQRDISRYKKSFLQAERDLQSYRLQVQEMREKNRGQGDRSMKPTIDSLRQEIDDRDAVIRKLRSELQAAEGKHSEEVEGLREDIDDLEATVRDKDRVIEEREGDLDEWKRKDSRQNMAVSDIEDELQRTKEDVEEMQKSLEQAKAAADEARDVEKQARKEKEQAEQDLKELQEEIANKTFSTKTFSRQLEEKASRLEGELDEIQREDAALKRELDAKKRRHSQLEEEYHGFKRQADDTIRGLQDELANKSSAARNSSYQLEQRVSRLEGELHETRQENNTLERELDRKTRNESHLQAQYEKLKEQAEEDLGGVREEMAKRSRGTERVNSESDEAYRETDQKNLHELVRMSNLEAESLELKLSERDAHLGKVESQLHRIREDRAFYIEKAETLAQDLEQLQEHHAQEAEKRSTISGENKGRHEKEIRGLEKEIAWLRARLREDIANKSFSAKEFTRQLEQKAGRLEGELDEIQRENTALKRELDTQQHLEQLQEHYAQEAEKLFVINGENKTRHEKEIRGLGKEITWLRTRLKREQRFRRDIAWSKGLMELGEHVRVAWYVKDLSSLITRASTHYASLQQ